MFSKTAILSECKLNINLKLFRFKNINYLNGSCINKDCPTTIRFSRY